MRIETFSGITTSALIIFFISSNPALALTKAELKAKRSADSGPMTFSGNCSWYGPKFHGKKTASGEKFNMYSLSAAHRTLPFGTKVQVENPKNGKSVVVKVNDRGPYAKKRVLDLSRAAATKIGIITGGTAFLECTVLPDEVPEASI